MYKNTALRNEKDLRDIPITAVQAVEAILPEKFMTDISFIPVLNQKMLGSCVGHAHAIVQIYHEYKESGKIPNLSPRYIYALSKKLDGLTQEGTYPRIANKVMTDKGCVSEGFCPNNTDLTHAEYINLIENEEMVVEARKYRIKGYVSVIPTLDAIKSAIVKNGLITATLSVGDWSKSPVKTGEAGLHRITLIGYDGDKIYFRNSWSDMWSEKGVGYFLFSEHQGKIYDVNAYTDIPAEIILEAKKKYRYFSENEVRGLQESLVRKLDELRGLCGFPIKINSGFRTKEENAKLKNSVEDSAHLVGLACDLACIDSTKRFKIIENARKVGFTRFGLAKTFLHLDLDLSKPQNIIYLYD